MGNIYGVANPIIIPVINQPGSDVACSAGVETTIMNSGILVAGSPGDYFPVIWLTTTIAIGATAPTAMVAAFKIGAGSDVDTYAFSTTVLVANANLVTSITLLGANSGTAWIGAGNSLNITINPTAQAVTVRTAGTRAVVALFRGPDA